MKTLFLPAFMKLIIILTLAFNVQSSFAQMTVVRNFNATTSSTFNYNSDDVFLAKLGDKVFVRYDTLLPGNINKVLLSSLTIAGQREKIILCDYPYESNRPAFSNFKLLPGDKMAFVMEDDNNANKIIVTDGTLSGTQVVLSSTQSILGMEVLTDGLYITRRNQDGINDELVKIDLITYAETTVKTFINFYSISELNKTDDNTLVFMATVNDGSYRLSLFKSDGTSDGTVIVKDLYTGNGVSQQTVMTRVGSKVFFFYKENGSDCCNFLWVTDGTTAGTLKLKEFNAVFFVDYKVTGNALAWNNKFYFMAVNTGLDTNSDRLLWVSDGTVAGTGALTNSANYTRAEHLTLFNNLLYFIAFDENAFNFRLCKTDGTVGGTSAVNVRYNTNIIYAYEVATDGSYLYLAGDNSGRGAELFRYNGSAVECSIAEGVAGSRSSDPKNLYVNGTDLFFTAELAATGREVYTAFRTITTSVVMESINEVSSMFPNPARDQVEIKSKKPISQLLLIKNQGEEVGSSYETIMNISSYPAGIYVMKVIFEDQTMSYHKLVIAK
jgi:ELWxxDGT repeat protein